MPGTASGSELSGTARRASHTVTAISGRLAQKDESPVDLDQQAATRRAEQGRDPSPGRPQPDGAPARLALERRGQDRQRSGHQQGAGDPL
jgi:hypothetical protein